LHLTAEMRAGHRFAFGEQRRQSVPGTEFRISAIASGRMSMGERGV